MTEMARVIILVSHPTQYLSPVFRALAEQKGIELKVLYGSRGGGQGQYDPGFGRVVEWDIPLLDGYLYRFLSHRQRTGGMQTGVISELLNPRPDIVIIHGYNHLTNLLALLLCKMLHIKVILRADSRTLSQQKNIQRVLGYIKQHIVCSYDGYLTIGTLNRAYYLDYGIPSGKLFDAPLCVDNERFAGRSYDQNARRREKRRELGITLSTIVILFAGKLIPRKRAEDVIRAFARVRVRREMIQLVIAGSGEGEERLRRIASDMQIEDKVMFVGFVNQSSLSSLFAACDMFVFPSQDEPWGLIVNEVMSAGLPVIVSDDVGAGADLVVGKGTGLVYPMGDVEALADAIERLVTTPELRVDMGLRAVEVIREWDIAASVQGIVRAIRSLSEEELSAGVH